MNNINVREIMREPEPLFLRIQGPDRLAAAERLAATERIFEDWHGEINRTNLRELPPKLARLYEEASITLCMILNEEKQIVTGR